MNPSKISVCSMYTLDEVQAILMKRLKQCAVVLVILIILDVLYLLIAYRPDELATAARLLDLRHFGLKGWLKHVENEDRVYTERQAHYLLNPSSLLKEIEKINSSQNKHKSRVVLLKTHKTASSTLQNIILRHSIIHNATIAVPIYRASFLWPARFRSQFVKKETGRSQYDVLAHHAVLDKAELDLVMKPSVKYITILRDPVALFRSAYQYFKMDELCFKKPIEMFMNSENYNEIISTSLCPLTKMPVRNMQAYDLGMQVTEMDDRSAVLSYIEYLDSIFSLVMITEHFDESLILLGKRLNWTLDDLVYFTQNAQVKLVNKQFYDQQPGFKELDENIRTFNTADDLIYRHFYNKLNNELALEFRPSELRKEVNKLRQLREDYYSSCVMKETADSRYFIRENQVFRPYGEFTKGFILKPQALNNITCRLLALPELFLTQYLKARAKYQFPY